MCRDEFGAADAFQVPANSPIHPEADLVALNIE
jgi:hypothetical protein